MGGFLNLRYNTLMNSISIENYWMLASIKYIIGLAILAIGYFLATKNYRQHKRVCTHQVQAIVHRYLRQYHNPDEGASYYNYTNIYRYEFGGKQYEILSTMSSTSIPTLNSTVMLMINPNNPKEVMERNDILYKLIFGFFTVLLIIVGLCEIIPLIFGGPYGY